MNKMRVHNGEGRLFFWGLVSLLLFMPLVRGGHQDWPALLFGVGVGTLLMGGLLRNLWRGSLVVTWRPEDVLLLFGLLWVSFGLSRPFAPPDAFVAFLFVLSFVCCFFMFRKMAFTQSFVLPLAIGLSLIGGLSALFGLLQMLDFLPHGWWDPPQFMASTFVNHNHFAAYLELLLPVGLALWLTAPVAPAIRFLIALSAVLMMIAFMMGCSRGAWLSFVLAGIGVLGWSRLRAGRLRWISWRSVFAGAVSVAAAGFLLSRPPALARMATYLNVTDDLSAQMRLDMWEGSWNLIQQHLFLGHGLQSFIFTFPLFRPAGLNQLIDYAHNEYLQLVAELGLAGLVLVVLWSGLIGARMARLVRFSQTPWKQALGIAGLVGFVSFGLHSFVDFHWHIPGVALQFFAVSGLVTGMTYRSDEGFFRTRQATFHFPNGLMRRFVVPVLAFGCLAAFKPIGSLIVADVYAYQGGLENKIGRFEQAAALYQRAIQQAPFRPGYHRSFGDSLMHLADERESGQRRATLEQAAEAYREALELTPYDSSSAYALGCAAKTLGHLKEADAWLYQAVLRDPHNPLYWKTWGELKHILGDAPHAAAAFRRAASLARPFDFFPDTFDALDQPERFVELGESARFSGHLSFSETAFRIAREFDPNHLGAQVGLAVTLLNQEKGTPARALVDTVRDPAAKSKWFAELARYHFGRGEITEVQEAAQKSLKLDSTNVLAWHLKLMIAEENGDRANYRDAVEKLLSLNRKPVLVGSDSAKNASVVWEPEEGSYEKGEKIYHGWALWGKGTIRQPIYLPPGKVRFHVTASGTKAKGLGPTLILSWNGKEILSTEVKSESWTTFETEAMVQPGESLLSVTFPNDSRDPLTREDRNLKLEKILATWEPL